MREVVLLSSLVELPIINTNSPSICYTCRHWLTLLILHYNYVRLLRNHLRTWNRVLFEIWWWFHLTSSLVTSFFTTSSMVGLSHICSFFTSSTVGPISSISISVQPMTLWCTLKTYNNLSFWSSRSLLNITIRSMLFVSM